MPTHAAGKPRPEGRRVHPAEVDLDGVSFEDVDLVQVIAKARALGIPLPFAMRGSCR